MDRTPLPSLAIEGLRFRRYAGRADLAGLARVSQAAVDADGDPDRIPDADYPELFEHPVGWTPERDVVIALVGGETVAWGRVQVVLTPHDRYLRHRGYVLPLWQGRGIGGAILGYQEAVLAERAIDLDPADGRPVRYATWIGERQDRARRLLERHGYEVFHGYQEMRLDARRPLPPPRALADDIEVRALADDEAVDLVRALGAGFADTDVARVLDPDADGAELIRQPRRFRPVGYAAAVGGRFVGGVVPMLDGTQGLIDALAVEPAHRRRGIAWALLDAAARGLRAAGAEEVTLQVETIGQRAAVALYEAYGFATERRVIGYGRPFLARVPARGG